MPESAALTATRQAYDAAAPTYARLFRDQLRDRPLDRAMLGVLAEAVRETEGAGGPGRVADLGCGPGDVTAYLAGLGLDVCGVDASAEMIATARRTHPELRFTTGSMAGLDLADGSLAGVLSRWSVIHTPPRELPAILAEFHRVLAPGGHLLIGFWATDDAATPTEVFDHAVAPAYRWWPDRLAELLRAAGLTEVARAARAPQPADRRQFRETHLLARRGD